ncbi:flagellar hook protein FlgE [Curtobacterium sp. MCBD17_040]|uniref:flagellar hook protein FlgE n=1 Tax=Curtobacterium sp. MCBD17_040 TaxID=2175674 RepID=UPI000DA89E72|nr:flagellar hook protein FlgE [Curtobacterium sp. MCBD17_040]WIB65583.1 flagellar hook protein FlgE [Curtobacterium sp. MCBD17_040]
MLRSLYSGISGLQSQQTMLDTTANNIANVNTVGFKSSSVEFEDTLSQTLSNPTTPTAGVGGTNGGQVGLGVRVAGVTKNLVEGSAQTTGDDKDMMINGDGYFPVSVNGRTEYTRDGAFSLDTAGNLVTADGGIVQGWPAVNGAVNNGGIPQGLNIRVGQMSQPQATSTATVTGNLPSDAANGTVLNRDITVYNANGAESQLSLAFTKTAAGWNVATSDSGGATAAQALTFTNGQLTAPTTVTSASGIAVNLAAATDYAGTTTAGISGQNGFAAGTLQSFTVSSDGTLQGTFSNGQIQPIGQVALATFSNPEGLVADGNSNFSASTNSGVAQYGVAGSAGFGSITGGALEQSNVDLSQEFTNLIIAQRAFQASARVVTTSDQILQQLDQLQSS